MNKVLRSDFKNQYKYKDSHNKYLIKGYMKLIKWKEKTKESIQRTKLFFSFLRSIKYINTPQPD